MEMGTMSTMMTYPGDQMDQTASDQQQVYMFFQMPILSADAQQHGGNDHSAWVPMALQSVGLSVGDNAAWDGGEIPAEFAVHGHPQMPDCWPQQPSQQRQQHAQGSGQDQGEIGVVQPSVYGQQLHWYRQSQDFDEATAAQDTWQEPGDSMHRWADPSVEGFRQSLQSRPMDASAMPFQPAQEVAEAPAGEAGAQVAADHTASFTTGAAGSRPIPSGAVGKSWSRTISALNLEPRMMWGGHQFWLEASEQEKMRSPLSVGPQQSRREAEAITQLEPVAAVSQWSWGSKPDVELDAPLTAMASDVDGSALKAGKAWGSARCGAPVGANTSAAAAAKVENVPARNKLEEERAEEWPSLMPTLKPKRGVKVAAGSPAHGQQAQEAAATPKAAELPSRVVGTAWGNAGGAVKHLKDIEAENKTKGAKAAKTAEAEEAESTKSEEATKAAEVAAAASAEAEREREKEKHRQAAQVAEAALLAARCRRAEEERLQREAEEVERQHQIEAARFRAAVVAAKRTAAEALAVRWREEEQRCLAGESAVHDQEEGEDDNEADDDEHSRQAEAAAEGWEDDNWQDSPTQKPAPANPAAEAKLASSVKQVASENEDSESHPSAEWQDESSWEDGGWQSDADATFTPAHYCAHVAQVGAAAFTSPVWLEAKQGRSQEVEEETCTPSTSSDEAQMNTRSVSPKSSATEEELSRSASTAATLDRSSLMAFRSLAGPMPRALASFCAARDEAAWRLLTTAAEPGAASAGQPSNRRIFGSRPLQRDRDGNRTPRQRDRGAQGTGAGSSSSSRPALPVPSATAYRPQWGAQVDRTLELKRSVQSSLNKICPENVDTIVGKIAETKVASSEELEMVIGLIMKKAHAEPHYCETYADLVYKLKEEMPEFPAADADKSVSFRSTLLNCCQDEFESMTTQSPDLTPEELSVLDPEEVAVRKSQRKARTLANIKFIGHLFLRQLLTAKIIGSIISGLAMCECVDVLPGEHVLECICELLNSIGYTLESMPAGRVAVSQVCGRLMDLKSRTDTHGKSVYCKRIQFGIQDLLDTRAAGWTKKVFKAAAKTKEEIRNEQSRDIKAQAAGKGVDGSEQVIAGARPAWLTSGPNAGRNDSPWQEVSKVGRR